MALSGESIVELQTESQCKEIYRICLPTACYCLLAGDMLVRWKGPTPAPIPVKYSKGIPDTDIREKYTTTKKR